MVVTVFLILAAAALIITLVHAARPPVPLWIAVILLCIIELIRAGMAMGH